MKFSALVDDFLQDVRYAFRTLRRDAGLTTFAILIVGLGIGASVTVFSISNAMLLRPLPFRDASRLIWISNGPSWNTQVNHFLDLSAQNTTLDELGAYYGGFSAGNNDLTGAGDPVRLSGLSVTQNFFHTLGVQPVAGRTFTAEETSGSGPRVALISHSLWTERFASDPTIVGRALTINNAPVTVIGVLPESFDFGSIFAPGSHIDLYYAYPLIEATNRNGNTLAIVARLKPQASMSAATAEITAIGKRLTDEHVADRNPFKPQLSSLRQHVSGSLRAAMLLLALGVGAVMLIVCANLSNLLLARATTRHQEVAIRAALGASRARQMRQMLTESLILASAGALLGLTLAYAGTRMIAGLSAITLPLLQTVHIDALSLAFAMTLALAAGLLFGLAPALRIPAAAIHDSLRVSGRSATDGGARKWTRNALVVSEIALACVLLVGAGLLSRSFLNVLDVDLGFKPERVTALRVDADRRNMSADAVNAYYDDVLARTKQIPGVTNAAITDMLPLSGDRSWSMGAKGHVYAANTRPETYIRVVTDGYAATMGIRIVKGRDFTAEDRSLSEPVALVNETFARTLWPDEDPIDKIIVNGNEERRVVGVVRDVRHAALEKGSGNEFYMPMRQTGDYSATLLVVRTTLSTAAFAGSIRTALGSIAPGLATNQIRTLDQIVDSAVSPRRFFTLMLTGFALFALGLALIGIYGVISYTVTQRTQEIAVRMALGATAGHLQARIIQQTLALAGIGMVIGTVASWALTRTLGGFLFGVTATDPVTFAGMLLILAGAAVLASYIPARRASRIDPMMAIRGS